MERAGNNTRPVVANICRSKQSLSGFYREFIQEVGLAYYNFIVVFTLKHINMEIKLMCTRVNFT